MMYRILKTRKRKCAAAIFTAACTALLIVWGIRFRQVNELAFPQKTEVYSMDEDVALEGNFYLDGSEYTEGYTVRVTGARLADYDDFTEEWRRSGEILSSHHYVYLVDLTISNKGNTDGYLQVMGWTLTNGALGLPLDYTLWNLMDPAVDGKTVLKLRENSEVSLTLPFTAQELDELTDEKELIHRMETSPFQLNICLFPVKKSITVQSLPVS